MVENRRNSSKNREIFEISCQRYVFKTVMKKLQKFTNRREERQKWFSKFENGMEMFFSSLCDWGQAWRTVAVYSPGPVAPSGHN